MSKAGTSEGTFGQTRTGSATQSAKEVLAEETDRRTYVGRMGCAARLQLGSIMQPHNLHYLSAITSLVSTMDGHGNAKPDACKHTQQ